MGGATHALWIHDVTVAISIHAPRGGSDDRLQSGVQENRNFNPRSPWGERRNIRIMEQEQCLFQSTLPVGGATSLALLGCGATLHFNPRSPWGERHGLAFICVSDFPISIHAPRGGSDEQGNAQNFSGRISIHAPRGGSDPCSYGKQAADRYFNPRSPWGERLSRMDESSLSVDISIHAPRGGSDGWQPVPRS